VGVGNECEVRAGELSRAEQERAENGERTPGPKRLPARLPLVRFVRQCGVAILMAISDVQSNCMKWFSYMAAPYCRANPTELKRVRYMLGCVCRGNELNSKVIGWARFGQSSESLDRII
jgi:hypothetical protein